jgi:hypothetical protein
MNITNGREAEAKLRATIDQRLRNSQAVIEATGQRMIQDSLIAGRAMQYGTADETTRELVLRGPQDFLAPLHPHARTQVFQKGGVDGRYAGKLFDGAAWQRELLIHILNETYHHSPSSYLVRRVNGQALGVLSDKFRRIDSRPLLDAVVNAMQAVGAQPYGGLVTETRVSLRAIGSDVIELLPGEWGVFGAEWSNSEFGDGKNSIRAFFERLVCLNGMTTEDVFGQVHLGRKLTEDIVFSAETYRLDHETTKSATFDAVKAVFSQERRDSIVARIKKAADSGITFKGLAHLKTLLSKEEYRQAEDAFNGPDIVNLPEGETTWRASNALSWIAQAKTVTPVRRLELERMAGQIVDGTLGKAEDVDGELVD